MKLKTIIKATAAAAALAAASVANANLIVNGSFETPDVDAVLGVGGSLGSWQIYTGSTVTGWNTGSYGIELQKSGTVVNAQDGDQYVELDTTGNSYMIQQLTGLTVGSEYVLSFYYQPRLANPLAPWDYNDNGINVLWGYNPVKEIASIANEYRTTSTDWVQYLYKLTATNSTMYLGFEADGSSNSYGGLLDNVTLTAVPEPATLALLGLGLAGLGLARRKQA